jgi:chromosome segregation ATPase
VVGLLVAADSASFDPPSLIKQHEEFQKLGLSPGDAAKALNLKKELEEMGLGLSALAPVIEIAKKHGEPQQIIQALSKYGSLIELTEQVGLTKNELESLGQQLQEAEAKLTQLMKPIEAYERAVKLGFTEQELDKLSGLSAKFCGTDEVLKVVEAYTSHADISNETAKAKAELGEIQGKINKLETQYSHLKTVTTMCDNLIQQYKFGLDAISTIFSVAKKYGDPVDVLKSIEVYGKLQALQQELNKLRGNVAERKELLAQLEGKHKEALEQLESLNAAALKVGATVSKVENQLENSKDLQNLMNLINNPASADYEEYGPLVLVLATSLRKWAISYEHKFKLTYSIKNGLESLISELGGN